MPLTKPQLIPAVGIMDSNEAGEATIMRNQVESTPTTVHGFRLLPVDYKISSYDIGCGRGQKHCNHAGNARFRALVEQHVDTYLGTHTKAGKTNLIVSILALVKRGSGEIEGRFVKQLESGRWIELGDSACRDKVSNALRSAAALRRSSTGQDNAIRENGTHSLPPIVEGSQSATHRQVEEAIEMYKRLTSGHQQTSLSQTKYEESTKRSPTGRKKRSDAGRKRKASGACKDYNRNVAKTAQEAKPRVAVPEPTSPVPHTILFPRQPVVTPREDDCTTPFRPSTDTMNDLVASFSVKPPLAETTAESGVSLAREGISETLEAVATLFLLKSGMTRPTVERS